MKMSTLITIGLIALAAFLAVMASFWLQSAEQAAALRDQRNGSLLSLLGLENVTFFNKKGGVFSLDFEE